MEKLKKSHAVFHCCRFKQMSSSQQKNVMFKASQCFNCLGEHKVKDCLERRDWWCCMNSVIIKHFYLLDDCFVPNDADKPKPPAPAKEQDVTLLSVGETRDPTFSEGQ